MIKVLIIAAFLFATLAVAQEPSPAVEQVKWPENDSVVYITREGKKYHRDGCQYLNKSKLKITLREAIENRYEPCKRCYKASDRDSL